MVGRSCKYAHVIVRGVCKGWFVCRLCGEVFGCPGCVVVSEEGLVQWCSEHQYLATRSWDEQTNSVGDKRERLMSAEKAERM
jgi:hypothetical protein